MATDYIVHYRIKPAGIRPLAHIEPTALLIQVRWSYWGSTAT